MTCFSTMTPSVPNGRSRSSRACRPQKRYLDRLIAEGTVHESEPGRYWLDLPVFREQRRRQFVWTMWVLGLSAVVVVVVWIVQALTG